VDIGLMSGVEDDRVAGTVEDPVHRDGEFDHAEVRAQVAAASRHGADQHLTNLRAQAREVLGTEIAQVGRSGDLLEQHKISLVEVPKPGAAGGGRPTGEGRGA
jgi:hypothetical protein